MKNKIIGIIIYRLVTATACFAVTSAKDSTMHTGILWHHRLIMNINPTEMSKAPASGDASFANRLGSTQDGA